ncbi:MAG: nucleotidyltransferase domain-containing protein [bacterium]|nr:nucleotidyltransferase domain-containing protein [bacterium]
MELSEFVARLETREEVDALFLTGSSGSGEEKPWSDIDVVIILKKNPVSIQSVAMRLGTQFADVFFFDRDDIIRIESAQTLPANDIGSLLVPWLETGKILFDKSGKTTSLKRKTSQISLVVPKSEQRSFCRKINYNYIANRRYFSSNNALYNKGLELRLLYSVMELVVGYFSFRGIPWRGEKAAVSFLESNDAEFAEALEKYHGAQNLDDRFSFYETMVNRVFHGSCQLWTDVTVSPVGKTGTESGHELLAFFSLLFGSDIDRA